MPNIPTVRDVLAIARKERDRLRGELAKLQVTIEYLESVLDIESAPIPDARDASETISTTSVRGMSAPRAAERILQEHGKPLTLKKIIQRMIAAGFEETNPRKLYSNLYTNMSKRKPTVFKKLKGKRAVFALVEWDKHGSLEIR